VRSTRSSLVIFTGFEHEEQDCRTGLVRTGLTSCEEYALLSGHLYRVMYALQKEEQDCGTGLVRTGLTSSGGESLLSGHLYRVMYTLQKEEQDCGTGVKRRGKSGGLRISSI